MELNEIESRLRREIDFNSWFNLLQSSGAAGINLPSIFTICSRFCYFFKLPYFLQNIQVNLSLIECTPYKEAKF